MSPLARVDSDRSAAPRRIALSRVVIGVLIGMLCACTKPDQSAAVTQKQSAPAQATTGTSQALAYEHALEIETDDAKVAGMFEAAQAACRAAAQEQCAVLDAHISTGRFASASLKFRARPEGVRKLIASVSAAGVVKSQSTTAEDLGAPIADVNKRAAMLAEYRRKLEAFLARTDLDVDATIKLDKELAQVQSDIEAINARQAGLSQRVDTEILNLSIASSGRESFAGPISEAISGFGGNLARGISSAITGLAYLLPWALVLALAIWLARLVWRKRRR